MKRKIVLIIIPVLLTAAGGGSYCFYENHLRHMDGYTVCPTEKFKAAATDPAEALSFVTEQSMVSLSVTERCSLDCAKGNKTACVLYGAAQYKGIFIMKDVSESNRTLSKACAGGETLACDLEKRSAALELKNRRLEIIEKARQKNRKVLDRINPARSDSSKVISGALAHFKGSTARMEKPSMKRWYKNTCTYLLFDKPGLSDMHRSSGPAVEKGADLEQFVQARYFSDGRKPDIELLNLFFEKFMRLGVMQIKLDYRVEKKKESDIPATSDYFTAKYTFLWNAAKTRLAVLDMLEKEINYSIEHAADVTK